MKWIGLTGGIGTGKSTVAGILVQDYEIPVIHADDLAHEAMKPHTAAWQQIVKTFGRESLTSSEEIDRRALGRIVFKDPQKLQQLEQILHPEVRRLGQALKQQYENQGHDMVFYDVPLLFEKKLQSQFDAIVVVTCDPRHQKYRIQSRDGLTEEEISDRLARQHALKDKEKQADYVLDNNGDLPDLERQIANLVRNLRASPTTTP